MNRPDDEQRQVQHRVAAVNQYEHALTDEITMEVADSPAPAPFRARTAFARAVLLELLGVP